MPDTPVAPPDRDPYDTALELRVSCLEEDMREETAARAAMAETLIRIEATLAAMLPHLATKADIAELKVDIARLDADKPSKTYMWGILAVLLTAYACGLAALAMLK